MIAALIKEISLTQIAAGNVLHGEKQVAETLYFGGGTPSILESTDLQKLFNALKEYFIITDDTEITLECNPDDIHDAQLKDWRGLGINRLSVGIQSFSDKELTWMNRAHTAGESITCIDRIKEAGFNNFSVDLIYGTPGQTNEDWLNNMDIVIAKDIPHISCYALTVEPKTALDKMIHQKKTAPVDADKQAEQFILLMNTMDGAGYEHYEISNFAKPGMRSRHNSSYWSGESYYGFGPSAHSFDGKKRRWNVSNNALYLRSIHNNQIPYEEEILTTTQQLNEYIMTSLRTKEGLDLEILMRRFGKDKRLQLEAICSRHIENKKMEMQEGKLILTKEGKLFADGIAADLFF